MEIPLVFNDEGITASPTPSLSADEAKSSTSVSRTNSGAKSDWTGLTVSKIDFPPTPTTGQAKRAVIVLMLENFIINLYFGCFYPRREIMRQHISPCLLKWSIDMIQRFRADSP